MPAGIHEAQTARGDEYAEDGVDFFVQMTVERGCNTEDAHQRREGDGDDLPRAAYAIKDVDWVEKLLNGAYDESKFDSAAYTGSFTYTNYMPAAASGADALEVKVVKADGSGVETIKKDYAKNITTVMNEVSNKNGATLVKALRDYIDTTYGGYYGENRADLFVGQNAAWDADKPSTAGRVPFTLSPPRPDSLLCHHLSLSERS